MNERVFSCVWLLATPWTVAHQAALSMEFFRQEYWSGLPSLPPGDLPDPGIRPPSPNVVSYVSCITGRFFFTTWAIRKSLLGIGLGQSAYGIFKCSPERKHTNPEWAPVTHQHISKGERSWVGGPSMQCVCLVMPDSLRPHGLHPPGFSVHGISQARILEWVAVSFSKRSCQPRDWTHVSCISCISRQIL